jgi:hypothetical protein
LVVDAVRSVDESKTSFSVIPNKRLKVKRTMGKIVGKNESQKALVFAHFSLVPLKIFFKIGSLYEHIKSFEGKTFHYLLH